MKPLDKKRYHKNKKMTKFKSSKQRQRLHMHFEIVVYNEFGYSLYSNRHFLTSFDLRKK